jgi:hypothetical protein
MLAGLCQTRGRRRLELTLLHPVTIPKPMIMAPCHRRVRLRKAHCEQMLPAFDRISAHRRLLVTGCRDSADQLAIYAGMSGRERVTVLLRLLGVSAGSFCADPTSRFDKAAPGGPVSRGRLARCLQCMSLRAATCRVAGNSMSAGSQPTSPLCHLAHFQPL